MATKKKDGGGDECAYCSTTEGDLKKCTRCRLVCYCSKACQTAHWKAIPGHRDRCVAPKDRKPSTLQPKTAEVMTTPSEIAEKDLCGVCFEPLLAENVLQSGAPHAGTQTLVCNHSFHWKCASELTALSANPLCPLCRGPFSSILPEILFLEAKKALLVILSMADEGHISWVALPPSVKTRMRSIMRKHLEAASRGHAGAQSALGATYRTGEGAKQDMREAAKWYRLAAEQGVVTDQLSLAMIYFNGQGIKQDFKEAAKWYREAANRGYAPAQLNLGNMYQNGFGVQQDFQEAVKWFRHAASQGLSKAQSNLGAVYANGDQGVKRDDKEALKWFRLAAAQGDGGAQFNLGQMYQYGYGVKQDEKEAARLYRQAANQGHAEARLELSRMMPQKRQGAKK
jgi:hypothetical protein